MKFSFLHAADLHLDSPLRGLARYPDMPQEKIRGATRKALENLVKFVLENKVDFVLLAGDLYDGDWQDYRTGLFFIGQMGRLNEANVPVFVVSGNHDALSQITLQLREPDNVRRFSTRKVETEPLEDLGVLVHGRGFNRRTEQQNLAASYPTGRTGYFNIGLLHTSLDGRLGHDPYAPCSLDDLASKNYQYWALGHVHRRKVVSTDPYVVYPGNLQGRHVRERGPRGATLVTVQDGQVDRLKPLNFDVLRWAHEPVDIGEARTEDEALEIVGNKLLQVLVDAGDRQVVARVELVGHSEAHGALHIGLQHWIEELRAWALGRSLDRLWLEKVVLSTRPAVDIEQALSSAGALGELMRAVHGLELSDDLSGALTRDLEPLTRRVRRALSTAEPPYDPASPEALTPTVRRAQELLLARLGQLEVEP